MSSLTGTQVWAALLADPMFGSEIPEGSPIFDVLRPYIEAAPTALAKFLDKPMTLEGFTEVEIAFLRYCLDSGFVEKIEKIQKMGEVTGIRSDLSRPMLEGFIKIMESVLNQNMYTLFEKYGLTLTEEQVILSLESELNDMNRILWARTLIT